MHQQITSICKLLIELTCAWRPDDNRDVEPACSHKPSVRIDPCITSKGRLLVELPSAMTFWTIVAQVSADVGVWEWATKPFILFHSIFRRKIDLK